MRLLVRMMLYAQRDFEDCCLAQSWKITCNVFVLRDKCRHSLGHPICLALPHTSVNDLLRWSDVDRWLPFKLPDLYDPEGLILLVFRV